MPDNHTAARLEHLRAELRAERISTGELIELQGLADEIPADDVELLEAAGVPEDEYRARLVGTRASCPHCGAAPADADGLACAYCRGLAHRPSNASDAEREQHARSAQDAAVRRAIDKCDALLHARSVADEQSRLERELPDSAPFGGWYCRAVETVAERVGINPYTLDRNIRATRPQ